jgi:hypothetical protein
VNFTFHTPILTQGAKNKKPTVVFLARFFSSLFFNANTTTSTRYKDEQQKITKKAAKYFLPIRDFSA